MRYLCSYQHEGEEWCFEISAETMEEARSRVRSLRSSATLDGEIALVVPAWMAPLAALWARLRGAT